jgi:hypothetical protein
MAAPTHDPPSPPVDTMHDDLERIKQDLLARYESGAPIDIAAWTMQFPTFREEILDYWMWLEGTPRLRDMDMTQSPDSDDTIAYEAIRDACLSVLVDPRGLVESVDPDAGADKDLGAQLAQVRELPSYARGRAPKEFRRAVVYTWIVQVLAPQRERVSRLAAQKVAYLLEQALGLGLFTDHEPKLLGPYDSRVKYRDAEPIAAKQGWINVQAASLEPQRVDVKFERYLHRYLPSEALARSFVTRLGRLTDEQLETWATVLWAGRALVVRGAPVTTDTVKSFLHDNVEWRPKLKRENFSSERIAEALARLSQLRLLQL